MAPLVMTAKMNQQTKILQTSFATQHAPAACSSCECCMHAHACMLSCNASACTSHLLESPLVHAHICAPCTINCKQRAASGTCHKQ